MAKAGLLPGLQLQHVAEVVGHVGAALGGIAPMALLQP